MINIQNMLPSLSYRIPPPSLIDKRPPDTPVASCSESWGGLAVGEGNMNKICCDNSHLKD